jgi:nucleoid-associated protein EbfC
MSDMPDMNQLLNQAMQMQQQLLEAQEEAAHTMVEGAAGGGMVRVHMTADGQVKSVLIDPKVVDPEDVAMLEDLVLAAFMDASSQAAAVSAQATQSIMGGMNLDGMALGGIGGLGARQADDDAGSGGMFRLP